MNRRDMLKSAGVLAIPAVGVPSALAEVPKATLLPPTKPFGMISIRYFGMIQEVREPGFFWPMGDLRSNFDVIPDCLKGYVDHFQNLFNESRRINDTCLLCSGELKIVTAIKDDSDRTIRRGVQFLDIDTPEYMKMLQQEVEVSTLSPLYGCKVVGMDDFARQLGYPDIKKLTDFNS